MDPASTLWCYTHAVPHPGTSRPLLSVVTEPQYELIIDDLPYNLFNLSSLTTERSVRPGAGDCSCSTSCVSLGVWLAGHFHFLLLLDWAAHFHTLRLNEVPDRGYRDQENTA
ncbi:hypothetical protein J4Q44_G00243100 [Coregonus suidteri]|uniref:Uncharacterized protein n=1 Tax=Coregonus suidteri TaxID=861788 RepID=A0AAN8LFE1_9TELE